MIPPLKACELTSLISLLEPRKLTFVIASLPPSTTITMTMMREIEGESSKLDSMREIEGESSKLDSMREIEEGSSKLDS